MQGWYDLYMGALKCYLGKPSFDPALLLPILLPLEPPAGEVCLHVPKP